MTPLRQPRQMIVMNHGLLSEACFVRMALTMENGQPEPKQIGMTTSNGLIEPIPFPCSTASRTSLAAGVSPGESTSSLHPVGCCAYGYNNCCSTFTVLIATRGA